MIFIKTSVAKFFITQNEKILLCKFHSFEADFELRSKTLSEEKFKLVLTVFLLIERIYLDKIKKKEKDYDYCTS